MTNRLIIVGSPRVDGRSAALADLLFESCIEEHPDEEVALVPVSTLDIAGCTGCNGCAPARRGADAGGAGGDRDGAARFDSADADAADAADGTMGGAAGGAPANVRDDGAAGAGVGADARARGEAAVADGAPMCVIGDDMQEVYPLIDAADELVVVSPVYFAGAPSQLKALLDRLQPYFWTDARNGAKRPATLHVVGEGGDPHGFDALITVVKSALSVAGFRLDTVLDWVGRIDEAGEIVEEAVVYDVSPRRPQAHAGNVIALERADFGAEDVQERAPEKQQRSKPRLDLGLNGTKPGVAAERGKRKGAQGTAKGRSASGKGSGEQGARDGRGRSGTASRSRGKGGAGGRSGGRNGKRRG